MAKGIRPGIRRVGRRAQAIYEGLPQAMRYRDRSSAERFADLVSSREVDTDDQLVERINRLKDELAGKFIRQSRASYAEALAGVYELYVRFENMGVNAQRAVYLRLGMSNRDNANPAAEFLKLLIDYPVAEGSRAGARARSRDAAVLEWAYSRTMMVEDFRTAFGSGQFTLEGAYQEQTKARAAKKRAAAPPDGEVERSSPPHDQGAEEDADSAGADVRQPLSSRRMAKAAAADEVEVDGHKWRIGAAFAKKRGRGIYNRYQMVFVAEYEPETNRTTILRVYQGTGQELDLEKLRDIMEEAELREAYERRAKSA